ncbi:MAG: hypothetical protein RLZ75_1707 [Pseudomonadota bacterium]
MKTKICKLLAISALGLSTSVFAGEGGVAGAISFDVSSGGLVTNASSAIAVGKNAAYAGSTTAGGATGLTEAFAGGGAGTITMSGVYIGDLAVNDTTLATPQANQLDTISTGLSAAGVVDQTVTVQAAP